MPGGLSFETTSFCFPLPQIYLKINCESDACFRHCCNEQFLARLGASSSSGAGWQCSLCQWAPSLQTSNPNKQWGGTPRPAASAAPSTVGVPWISCHLRLSTMLNKNAHMENLKPREFKQLAQGRTVGSHTQAGRCDSLHFTVSKLTGSLISKHTQGCGVPLMVALPGQSVRSASLAEKSVLPLTQWW